MTTDAKRDAIALAIAAWRRRQSRTQEESAACLAAMEALAGPVTFTTSDGDEMSREISRHVTQVTVGYLAVITALCEALRARGGDVDGVLQSVALRAAADADL